MSAKPLKWQPRKDYHELEKKTTKPPPTPTAKHSPRTRYLAFAVCIAATVVCILVIVSLVSSDNILGLPTSGAGGGESSASSTGGVIVFSASSSAYTPPVGGSAVYPYPPPAQGTNTSFQYLAWLSTNSTLFPVTPYQTWNPSLAGLDTSTPNSNYKAWISFAFTISATVTVQNSYPWTSARILPSRWNMAGTKSGSRFTFTVAKKGQYAIDWCWQGSPCISANVNLTYPFLVFADDIAEVVPAPDPSSSSVWVAPQGLLPESSYAPLTGQLATAYFGPGLYWITQGPFVLDTHQVMYIAAGAYVVGTVTSTSAGTNMSVVGPGVLSGAFNVHHTEAAPGSYLGPLVASVSTACTFWLQGITMVEPPAVFTRLLCNSGSVIENIKEIAWHPNTDGISVGQNTVVRNAFISTGDTAVHMNKANLTLYNITIWHLANFGMFANWGADSGFAFYDSDIIRTEWNSPYGGSLQPGIFSAFNSGPFPTYNFYVNNINIENSNHTIFRLLQRPFGGQTVLGVPWNNFTFTNINVDLVQQFDAMILAYDPLHPWTNFTFTNFFIAGVRHDNLFHVGYDVNRPMSLAGNFQYNPVFAHPTNHTLYQYWNIVPQTITSLVQPLFDSTYVYQGLGEYFGNGMASIVMRSGSQVGIWRVDHGFNTYTALTTNLPNGYSVMNTNGDYNGDGYTDILLWNNVTQTGKTWIITPGLTSMTPTINSWAPSSALSSAWVFGGATDINSDGYTDVVLNAPGVGMEVVFFTAPGVVLQRIDTPASTLTYSQHFNPQLFSGTISGTIPAAWQILSTGDFLGNGYSGIMWLGNTQLPTSWSGHWYPLANSYMNGNSIAQGNWGVAATYAIWGLNSTQTVVAVGDVNSDSADDMVVYDTSTSGYVIVYGVEEDSGGSSVGGPPSYNNAFSIQPTSGYIACWKPR